MQIGQPCRSLLGTHPQADNDRDIYLVFEHMETDLHAAIRANILGDVHKQYIMWQTLKALKFMHSANLLHRDMKPSNLLLNADCLMKVADFGLARSLRDISDASVEQPVLTDYVATRWYRAPEILLGSTRYTFGVDMWSMGCILAETLAGKPIFAGSSTIDQLERIIELTGRPSASDMEGIESPFAATMLAQVGGVDSEESEEVKAARWAKRFPDASADALDLLRQFMHFNPAKRISAAAALRHPYVSPFHNPEAERDAGFKVSARAASGWSGRLGRRELRAPPAEPAAWLVPPARPCAATAAAVRRRRCRVSAIGACRSHRHLTSA